MGSCQELGEQGIRLQDVNRVFFLLDETILNIDFNGCFTIVCICQQLMEMYTEMVHFAVSFTNFFILLGIKHKAFYMSAITLLLLLLLILPLSYLYLDQFYHNYFLKCLNLLIQKNQRDH